MSTARDHARTRSSRRRGRALGACLAAGLLLLPTSAPAGGAPAPGAMRYGAWITYWDFERGLEAAADPAAPLDEVFLFAAHLDPEGRPFLAEPGHHAAAVRALRAQGRRVWLTVVNDVAGPAPGQRTLKDAAVVGALLADPARQRTHRRQLRELALSLGATGLDVDYENLDPADRDLFTGFAEALAAELGETGLELSLTVQPKVGRSTRPGPGAMDWPRLCAAGRLQVMLYNLHSGRTGPGPMATPQWVEEVLRNALAECDPESVVPVLKVSGMEWGARGARSLQFEEAAALRAAHQATPQRDAAGVPHFSWYAGSARHSVWFEDARSLLGKIDVIAGLGLGRVVFWSLGRHDPELFAALRRTRAGSPGGR